MTATKTIKTYKSETLTITKLGSFSWYNTHAYGLTKKVVWQDENGGMWVRMNGEFVNVNFRKWGTYAQYVDTNAVEPEYFNRMYATEIA
jgi:hypothetical protein